MLPYFPALRGKVVLNHSKAVAIIVKIQTNELRAAWIKSEDLNHTYHFGYKILRFRHKCLMLQD